MKTSPTIAPAASGPRYDAVLQDWVILPLPAYPGAHILVGIVTNVSALRPHLRRSKGCNFCPKAAVNSDWRRWQLRTFFPVV